MTDDTAMAPHADAVLPRNRPAAHAWSNGGHAYDEISRQIADAIEHAVDRLEPRPGQRILDVATGTGWAARRIAARGAQVTGIDFGEDVIAAARRIEPGGPIEYRVADAEDLPFPDDSFDAVVSTFGVMFCGDPGRAAAELARVCRPGGRLVLTSWAAEGTVREMFDLIQSCRPTRPATSPPSPFEWGRTERVRAWLGSWFDLGFETAVSYGRAKDGAAVWDAFASGYGPIVTLSRQLDPTALQRLRAEFIGLHERFRSGAGVLVQRPYLVTVGERVA